MKLTIRKKMLAGFVGVTLLTLGLGIFALVRMSAMNHTAEEIATRWMQASEKLAGLRFKFANTRTKGYKFLITDEAHRPKDEEGLRAPQQELAEAQKAYEASVSGAEERERYDFLEKNLQEFARLQEQVVGLITRGKQKEAMAVAAGPQSDVYNACLKSLAESFKYNHDGAEAARQNSQTTYGSARAWVIGLLLVVVLLGVGIGLWLSRKISRPVGSVADAMGRLSELQLPQMAAAAQAVAAGDLTAEVDVRVEDLAAAGDDEVGQMTEAFNKMAAVINEMSGSFQQMSGGLRDSMGEIGAGSDRVAATSSQIAAASDQSKQSAQALASSSEQITATVHEMAASIRQVSSNAQTQAAAATETSATVTQMVAGLQSIAGNTKQLAALTTAAGEAAQTGQNTLARAGENIRRISSSVESAGRTIDSLGERAESIGKIVETIDDIADQTNLLALNAAIEAARAGEHGLGFAVVADEVRKLAERSARSTKEIGELIESIQREARSAVHQMEESNTTVREYMADASVTNALQRIIASVGQIVTSTHEIEAAISEQSAGAEEVSKATQELTRLTQEISAATEEQSTGAAEVVRAMEQMHDVVGQAAEMAVGLQGSAEQLYRQSDTLQGVIGRFTLKAAELKGEPGDAQPFAAPFAVPFLPDAAALRMNGREHPAH